MKTLIYFCSGLLLLTCDVGLDISDSIKNVQINLEVQNKLLKKGDSTYISLIYDVPSDSLANITWKIDEGKFTDYGTSIMYQAPQRTGSVNINAEIITKNGTIRAVSARLLIYSQIIFLKADDLVFDKERIISDRWRKFIAYIYSEQIKASLGLIGNSLTNDNPLYHSHLRTLAANDHIELFNHGYDHLINYIDQNGRQYNEFQSRPLAYQLEHLRATQRLAKVLLGVNLIAFSAPGNAIDEMTTKAMVQVDELKIWFLGPPDSPKLNLNSLWMVETQPGKPNYRVAVENYLTESDYHVIQLHPNAWNVSDFNEFNEIIAFLKNRDVTFMNPTEYYALINK